MKQVFILRCDWNIWGDTGHDIVGVYSSYESACRDLKVFADNEKRTSLETHFNNGVIKNNIKRKGMSVDAPKTVKHLDDDGKNPDLSKFHARELIAELKARGYKGEIFYVQKTVF